jgi:NAD(P)H-nitrite reductase large subunit
MSERYQASHPAFSRTSDGPIPSSSFKMPAALKVAGGAADAQRTVERALRDGATDVLIVGNGIAGSIAAMEMRRHAPTRDVLIVTEQNHPTINTPALKQFGAGKLDTIQLLAFPTGTERQHGVGVLQQRVERLDVGARLAHLSNGQSIKYRRLLLATGSQPMGLPASCPGRDFDGVITLHRLRDYLDLRRRLAGSGSAIVVGGGYHAAETAMLIKQCGVAVTWLIRGRSLASQLLDTAASDLVLRQIRRRGVDVRLETEVVGVVGKIGTAAGVVTSHGEFIHGDVIVVCTGVRPATDLARTAGLVPDATHGLPVDERLRTAAPNVWAAGDVASVPDPQTARRTTRAQWYFAYQQGCLAAADLAGIPIWREVASAALGAFWHSTQLGGLSVMVAGAPALTERDCPGVEVLTNDRGSFYRRIAIRQGQLVGYAAIGETGPNGLAIKRLIDEQIDITTIRNQLLAEDFDVRAFLTTSRLRALKGGRIAASSPSASDHRASLSAARART